MLDGMEDLLFVSAEAHSTLPRVPTHKYLSLPK